METTPQEELSRLLDDVFGTDAQRTDNLIRRYISLYSLPSYSKEWTVDPQFFLHSTRSVKFVVIALYNAKKEFFAIYSPHELKPGLPVGWRFLGGPILIHKKELIEEAVNRIVRLETGVDVAELEPIASLKQIYHWGDNAIEHIGLAFMARAVREPKLSNLSQRQYKFHLNPPDKMAFLNRKIFIIAQERLSQKYFEPPLEEVNPTRGDRLFYPLHRFIVKPLLYLFVSRPLKRKIRSFIGDAKTVLDVSAGDDKLIIEIAVKNDVQLCVANDISWRRMASLREKARRRHIGMIFTNHNMAELPFKKKFDVVICKNSLHHARTKEELLSVLRGVLQQGKRIIIIDVEDPRRERLAKIFHWYYVHLRGDQGHHFLNYDQFKKLFSLIKPKGSCCRIEKIKSIKGTYLLAVIECN